MRLTRLTIALAAVLIVTATTSLAMAQDLEAFEANLTQHTLDNGLTLLVYERPTAPVVSFFTLVDVGGYREVPGITGIAHMFEHMAFKGSTKIGTTDYKAEKKALAAVDDAYHAHQAERTKPGGGDPEKLEQLAEALKAAQDEAGKYVVKNEFSEIIDRAGGVGLNAFTGSDVTGYVFSLPANKVELWAYLESERFVDPVFREFYTERDVVMEERRMRIDSQPIGRLIEQALAAAFTAHPYRQPVVGYMSDLQSFTREDAIEFFEKYYVPSTMVIAIVGDVQAEEVVPVVEKYFGRLATRPAPPPLRTVEPEQFVERAIKLPDKSQPIYAEGYHKPAATHPDEAVYDVISDILSSGRTSRLYRNLVVDKKVAAQAFAFSGFPGNKYPNLYLLFAMAAPDRTNEEVQAAIHEELDKLTTEPVSDEDLERAKIRAKAGLVRGLRSNSGIAGQLATYHMLFGDWRELFRHVERIDKVTKEDVLRVAQQTFQPTNRTVGMIVNEPEPEETSEGEEGQ
jgi:predicted Zn-dependent peptidase